MVGVCGEKGLIRRLPTSDGVSAQFPWKFWILECKSYLPRHLQNWLMFFSHLNEVINISNFFHCTEREREREELKSVNRNLCFFKRLTCLRPANSSLWYKTRMLNAHSRSLQIIVRCFLFSKSPAFYNEK